ncbi:sensor histidine kinase [Paenibacillus aestuarii]|uniref:histidine kinase n=1 Tax=Paenibacillus aestuarii TaxID=516965 RepID=A0ABW0K5J4_9BACL|nr:sensor histidine kinase [Paenibacillus aestuarii]
MTSVRNLCLEHTFLTHEDVGLIEELSRQLQAFADVSQSDVFIDCPLMDNSSAIVVAQSQPATSPSLYRTSVVGQYAYAQNEPAVMYCLLSGKPVNGARGISQEQRVIQQNVVPIFSPSGNVIGALIMEQDLSEKLAQERHVERLQETTEHLSETLLNVAMSESGMPALMQEGMVLFDAKETVTYINPQARSLLGALAQDEFKEGCSVQQLFGGELKRPSIMGESGHYQEELHAGGVIFELKAVTLYRDDQVIGGVMLIRDMTDLKLKEKQLIIKSAVIKEIHHRVKNNLQNVSSLLRLQMRRSKQDEVKKVFQDSINRMTSIAILHEMLASDGLDTVPFQEVMERIAKHIVSASAKPEQQIRLAIHGDALTLPSECAGTLALVLNELVQNCVTHAFRDRSVGNIDIALQVSGQMARLTIMDDGVGMDTGSGEDSLGKPHLGLHITKTLVQENLGGVLLVESDDTGTSIRLTFPLAQTADREELL